MDALMNVTSGHIGILIWVLWAMIGLFEALLAMRINLDRNKVVDIIAGVVGAVVGGYFSIDFVGDGPVQRFLVSILGAVFLATVLLWIAGALMRAKNR